MSAMVDEGNVVVFGPRESNFENTGTGQRIPMQRRKGRVRGAVGRASETEHSGSRDT